MFFYFLAIETEAYSDQLIEKFLKKGRLFEIKYFGWNDIPLQFANQSKLVW